MKTTFLSALAFAALGVTLLSAQTTEASGWVFSGWGGTGLFNFATNGCDANHNCDGLNFAADYATACLGGVCSPSPYVTEGMTVSANTTGIVGGFPTCHEAWTLCSDSSLMIAGYVCATTVGGTANETNTGNSGPSSQGNFPQYWKCPPGMSCSSVSQYQQFAYPANGLCPNGTTQYSGMVGVFQF